MVQERELADSFEYVEVSRLSLQHVPVGHQASPQAIGGLYANSTEGTRLVNLFTQLVEPLGASLSSSSEVVLHDLSLLPNSIVAIYGNVTHRVVGGPATDVLLGAAAKGELNTRVGYETVLPDGRRLRSSTMIVRDVDDRPVAALCINSEVDVWAKVHSIAASMIGDLTETRQPAEIPERQNEVFVRDVEELASLLLRQAIDHSGVPVALMRKHHKVAVVRELKHNGMFMLRDATEMIASALQVTRFTIYNYLNEIGEDTNPNDVPEEQQ